MSEITTTAIVSGLSSATVLGLFAFCIKRYVDRYLAFHFDNKLAKEKMIIEITADLRKEFLTKSLHIYAQTSRIAYRCLLGGREILAEINTNAKINPGLVWDIYNDLQEFLSNQAFIDVADYRTLHAFKNAFQKFCLMCEQYADKYPEPGQDISFHDLELMRLFWQDVVEPAYREVQGICRLFSIKA